MFFYRFTSMRFHLLISVVIFLCHGFRSSDARDTIKQGESISFYETIVSAGKKYELGFIELQRTRCYVGIWYAADQSRSAVWVANRDFPVLSSADLTLTDEGNLVISDGQMTYMLAYTSAGPGAQARLLDSGNLIVQKGESELFWQSFDNPTNTLLPGMNIGYDLRTNGFWSLLSWKSANDPSPGNFTLLIDYSTLNLAVYYNFSDQYWVGNPYQYLGSNFYVNRNPSSTYITWFLSNSSKISRLVLDSKGQLVRQSWSESSLSWNSSSSSKCGVGSCGSNSICNVSSSPEQSPCCCLKGFLPPDESRSRNFTGDCVRRTNFTCDEKKENDVVFFKLSDVVPPANIIQERDTITTIEDCQSSCQKNCSCSGFSFIVNQRQCLLWTGQLLNMQTTSDVDSTILDFNLKVLVSEMGPGNFSRPDQDDRTKNIEKTNKIQVWVIAVLTCSLTLFALALLLYYARKRLLRKVGEDLLLFDLNVTPKDDESEFSETYGKEKSNEVKMPLFSFSSVSAATDNFSDENKLGEGGFGPVYKGKTLKGNEIAVKRLSQKSRQGWEELKNEALLIAKLQHKNLVRLLGCCIERDEKILIYEYMPNKSLDFFLFDPDRRKILDWGRRVRIVEGIAQGLLYLHEYSRFRIVHRDLKVSNILLDAEMNPKIADFGMARMFGGDESEANTNRIVGTFGYMPPEYALEGTYSTKSDVFSFGVLLLEIVSGRKNTGFYSNKASNLLGHAWDLWTSGKGLNLIDPDLKEVSSSPVGLRYVNIALLCVQDSPDDRPSMSNVVSMLGNETIALSQPNQPGFLNMRSGANSVSSKSRVEISSVDETPVGMSDPR